eukprot:4295795-Pyramimonas_sp.AAC.1
MARTCACDWQRSIWVLADSQWYSDLGWAEHLEEIQPLMGSKIAFQLINVNGQEFRMVNVGLWTYEI